MSDITDHDVALAMIAHGGGFVSGLGRLYLLADADNQYRLRSAFSAYWEFYKLKALWQAPEKINQNKS